MARQINSRHRSFTTDTGSKDAVTKLEDITFDLHGETFTALPEIQGIALMEFIEANTLGGQATLGALIQFLKNSMDDVEYEKLHVLLMSKDKTKNTPIDVIAEIVAYLVEEYTSRPTPAS